MALRHGQWLRFPSPLIKPDVRISRIRLSDWLRRTAHDGEPVCLRVRHGRPPSPCDRVFADGSELIGRFEARRQFARPPRLRKRARSQGPLLRRSYPASALVRPCPTPARSIAKCDVEAATSERTGLPRLPAMPFQRAASITPMDRTGACVDCFPVRATFPEFPAGRRPY